MGLKFNQNLSLDYIGFVPSEPSFSVPYILTLLFDICLEINLLNIFERTFHGAPWSIIIQSTNGKGKKTKIKTKQNKIKNKKIYPPKKMYLLQIRLRYIDGPFPTSFELLAR